jgi:hypothetical protein
MWKFYDKWGDEQGISFNVPWIEWIGVNACHVTIMKYFFYDDQKEWCALDYLRKW